MIVKGRDEGPAFAPLETRVDDALRGWARVTPHAIAVIAQDGTFSYADLDETSDRVAAALAQRGVGPGDRVGVCMGRSARLIVTLLAVLKLGAAYLPIAPHDPSKRVAELLLDAHPSLVACDPGQGQALAEQKAVEVLEINESILSFGGDRPERVGDPAESAYLMYTSGSTGHPKGVLVEHRSICNLVLNQDVFPFSRDSVVLHRAALVGDGSTFEVWGALLNGATLVVAPPDPVSADETAEMVLDYGVSLMFFTTALFHRQVDERIDTFRNFCTVVVGGEALSAIHAKRFLDAHDDCVLINAYGPTETTTFATCHQIGRDEQLTESVPIGVPLRGVRVHLIDESGMPVPDGDPGELCISGKGLARGYWRRPGLTAQRFVPDPFSGINGPGQRMYRTGDLAQRLPGGELAFLRRIDNQFKLRGTRIEPEEIEHVLTRSPAVRRAAVIVRRAAEDDRLTAYVVPQDRSAGIDRRELRRFTLQYLPGHMVPAQFMVIDDIPVTSNGKIDRRSLAARTDNGADATISSRAGDAFSA
jgi:amino acid adenylation domain-containing protein